MSKRKLTPDQVRQIRAMAGLYSHTELARRFHVSDVTIHHIIKRRIYKDVDPIEFVKRKEVKYVKEKW